MDMLRRNPSLPRQSRGLLAPSSLRLAPRPAFTLVELLVVITIIGILASLITVAAVGALKKAQQTRTKVELDQIAAAFETYKDKTTAYPPNLQTDDEDFTTGAEPDATPLAESEILNDLRSHIRQIAPRSREPDELLQVIVGLDPGDADFPKILDGGMTADEAVVFWLGGFSSDPAYPISGEGGPSYRVDNLPSGVLDNEADPIDNRNWIYPFAVERLRPRDANRFFPAASADPQTLRYIEYTVTVNGVTQTRRINFWRYLPAKSTQPYLYFDTSRHPAGYVDGNEVTSRYDPPAATEPTGQELHVHAVKKLNPVYDEGVASPIVFVNPDKFQILHCGIDDEWGVEEAFERMSAHGVKANSGNPNLPDDYLLYPTGPFTADVADTIVNFTTGTLEDEQ